MHPCHRHMVIATILGSLFCLAALQHKAREGGGGHSFFLSVDIVRKLRR